MMLQMNKVYVLNPAYHLRNDIHRVALFSRGGADSNCSRDWHTFIHPLQALLLSFFTYDRPLRETLFLLCDYFYRDVADMKKMVSEYIDNPTPVYTQWRDQTIYFPKHVLIEAEKAAKAVHFEEIDPKYFEWRKLDLTTRRLYSGPLLLTLMLTNRCATHCQYCYADTFTQVETPLSTPRIMELIHEAAKMQVQQVTLIGGEVFLHKDWKRIVKELVKLDIAPEFISTKIPMTAERVKDLQDTGYQGMIQVSLDACDTDVLQESLRVNARYSEEMLNGLRLLDESGLDYQVSTVLTTYNCEIEILTELYQELSELKHLREWKVVPVSNSITKDYKEFARLKPSKARITDVFNQLSFLVPHAPFPVTLGKEALQKQFYQAWGGSYYFKGSECSALTTHMFILPDGKVTACEQLYWHPRFIIGDVTKSSLKEVWDSPQARQLCSLTCEDISEKSACAKCGFFDDCISSQNRCWSDIIKAYGADCWDFPDPRCQFAPPMKNNLGYE